MDNLHNDERISAYLDGELSADEQSRFEERLAESAELRQLVEELRALRGSLDLLPRHRLEADFAERVLRRAEKEMLASGDGGSNSGPSSNANDSTSGDSSVGHAIRAAAGEPRNWKRRALRPLIYAAAAIAAAALIMIFNPPRNRDVAQLGDNGKPAQSPEGLAPAGGGATRAIAHGGDGKGANRGDKDDKKLESLTLQNSSPAARSGGTSFSDENGDRLRDQPELAKQGGSLAGQPSRGLGEGEVNSKTGAFAQSLGKTDQGQVEGRLNAQVDTAGSKGEQEGVKKPESSGREPYFAKTPASAPVPSESAGSPKGVSRSLAAGVAADRGDSTKEMLRRNLSAPDAMVVANCIASPEAAEHVFFGLLAKNDIMIGTPPDGAPTTYSLPRDRFAYKSNEPADKDKLGRASEQKTDTEERLGEIEKAKDQPRDVEVVYVEGTVEQIQGLVDDLKAKPTVFRSLKVSPAPAAPVAGFAYGGFAGDNRPTELQFRAGVRGGKPTPQDAERPEAVRTRVARNPAPDGESPLSDPAKAPTGRVSDDRSLSDRKALDELGSKLATSDKTAKNQAKPPEPPNAAIEDNAASSFDKATKPAENGSPKDFSPQFHSKTTPPPAGEKSPPVSGPAPHMPERSTHSSLGLEAPAVNSAPAAGPAARAAIASDSSRPLTRAEADKKLFEWRDKEEPARSEAAGAKREPAAPPGHAVRLYAWPLDSPVAQLEQRKSGENADYAPANSPSAPPDAGSVARGVERSPTDLSAAKKDEGKSPAAKLALPMVEESDRSFKRSESKSSARDAEDGLQAPPVRMRAIFVFRLAPVPVGAAAAAPGARPPAAQPPAAGVPAPASNESK